MKLAKRAFTLVELLVVIAILGILATVGVVSYTSLTKKGYISNTTDELTQVKKAITAVSLDANAQVYVNADNDGLSFTGKSPYFCVATVASPTPSTITTGDYYTLKTGATKLGEFASFEIDNNEFYDHATYYTLVANNYGWADVYYEVCEIIDNQEIAAKIQTPTPNAQGKITSIRYIYNEDFYGTWDVVKDTIKVTEVK